MMRKAIAGVLFLLAGCASAPPQTSYVTPSYPLESYEIVGRSHERYRGIPAYLAAARPLYPTRPTPESACLRPSPSCDDRLRAVLASLDGQVLALTTQPTPVQVEGLRLGVIELTPLTTPYPEMLAERNELGELVEKLRDAPPGQVPFIQKRMTQLVDLMRIQLAGAQ